MNKRKTIKKVKKTKKKSEEDKYIQRYLSALNEADTDIEKIDILNKVYEDGFEDGCNEG